MKTEFQSSSKADNVTKMGTSPTGSVGYMYQNSERRSCRSQRLPRSAPRLLGIGASKRRTTAFHCAMQALVSGNLVREQNRTQAEHALGKFVLPELCKSLTAFTNTENKKPREDFPSLLIVDREPFAKAGEPAKKHLFSQLSTFKGTEDWRAQS